MFYVDATERYTFGAGLACILFEIRAAVGWRRLFCSYRGGAR